MHVDGAMCGTAALCPEFRHIHDGLELADSYCFNPHKWMFTNFDCDCFWIADRAALIRTLSVLPEYLRNQATESGAVIDYRDWQIPLGRRFRSLKLWFHLRLDGVDAIQARIRRDLESAAWLADQVEAHPDWELVAPVPLQTVCVRHRPGGLDPTQLEAHTQRWVQAINDSGQAYLTPSLLGDSWMVRVSIGVESTERTHVEALWALMNETAEQCLASVTTPATTPAAT